MIKCCSIADKTEKKETTSVKSSLRVALLLKGSLLAHQWLQLLWFVWAKHCLMIFVSDTIILGTSVADMIKFTIAVKALRIGSPNIQDDR